MNEPQHPEPTGHSEPAADTAGKKPARWGLESPDELIGCRIDDRFTILERIARGGMGAVFKAIQAPMGRVCAVKVLSATYEGKKDPAFDKRFFREAATISRLRHPNTVTLYDYGNTGDLYYMVMEYVGGRTLFSEIRREGPLEERRARRIAMQICRSLREAHQHGVVHRDLKPDNVLLVDQARETDVVKVLDFGLAKVVEGEFADDDVTETGLCMGSPKHMAPEQIIGDTVSAHTDVYALGILMYEMLTAISPFDRPTRYQTLVAQVHEQALPFARALPGIDVSPEMESVVRRCLEKERHHRFPSMDAVLQVLKEIEGASRASMASLASVRSSAIISSVPSPMPVPGLLYTPPIVHSSDTPPSVPPSLYPPPSHPSIPTIAYERTSQPSSLSLGSVPPTPPLPVFPSDTKRMRRFLIAASAVGTIGLASLIGAWWFADTTPSDQAVAVLAGVSSVLAPSPSASTSHAPIDRIVVVETQPRGAKVFDGNKLLCEATPCRITWTERGGRQHDEWRMELPGHRAVVHRVAPGDDRIVVPLTVLPRGVRATNSTAPSSEDLADDTSYKYSPY